MSWVKIKELRDIFLNEAKFSRCKKLSTMCVSFLEMRKSYLAVIGQ